MNDKALPLTDTRVEVSDVSNEQDKYEDLTDKNGHYTIDLPEGTYKMRFHWRALGCSGARRPPFKLSAGEHLTFDFVTMHCPNIEVKPEVPYDEGNKGGFKSMNLPFAKQGRRYLEQLIPAEPGHWPEIIVSFGKYGNQPNEIRYFPLHQGVTIGPATAAPLLLSLPVTVTVDRYTVQAMEVVLDKKTMTFTAKGHVFISDGKSGKMGNYATLSFSNGQPNLIMKPWF